jgi:hypothetical protein
MESHATPIHTKAQFNQYSRKYVHEGITAPRVKTAYRNGNKFKVEAVLGVLRFCSFFSHPVHIEDPQRPIELSSIGLYSIFSNNNNTISITYLQYIDTRQNIHCILRNRDTAIHPSIFIHIFSPHIHARYIIHAFFLCPSLAELSPISPSTIARSPKLFKPRPKAY